MLGVYLHIPFCEKKCSYCDFYSLEDTSRKDSFVPLLIREVELRAARVRRTHADTVFFGGGTPSLLSANQIRDILLAVDKHIGIAEGAEITMECNPETVSAESLQGYRSAGVNRLSFGVQSFHDDELHFLDRIHDAKTPQRAVAMARSAGFDNINIDLMFALPGTSPDKWEYTLRTALSLGTEHISAYSLIFEPGTPLAARHLKGLVQPVDEDVDADLYERTMEILAEAGYGQYEISNWSREGRQCRHNLIYWHGHDHYAFGPSAHGMVGGLRWMNVRNLTRWGDRLQAGQMPTGTLEQLRAADLLLEYVFTSLRADGIDADLCLGRFGFVLEDLLPSIEASLAAGYLEYRSRRLSLTRKGRPVCDTLSADIIVALELMLGADWQSAPASSSEALAE